MAKINHNQFNNNCGEAISEFFKQITDAYCRSDDEVTAAFSSFKMRMLEGITFHTGRELNKRNLLLASAVVKLVGSENGSIPEIQELAFRTFADSILKDVDPTEEQYRVLFITSLENYLDVTFNYIGPCEAFEFTEGVTSLQSEYVSVVPAQELVSDAKFATKGKNWELVAGTKFSEAYSEAGMTVTIGDMCWHIASQSQKIYLDNGRGGWPRYSRLLLGLAYVQVTIVKEQLMENPSLSQRFHGKLEIMR